jgi:phosphopantothenoylcysteine decarboxylase/phosphopantothenate--cysteine ligase
MLKGKNIILGITGSIAAYKAATLARLMVKEGANVKVIMTPLAKEFITPLTMATLTKNPILVDFFNPENGDWNSHVDLGIWADLYLIAPATANTIAKMANGVADNLLLTTYLSARCPVVVAPAMDLDMFQHPATQKNLKILEGYGNLIVEPATGELASGLSGKGRMEEPEQIVEFVKAFFFGSKQLANIKVLVTSGPTFEPIDPVRFIGNRSSGKMGKQIALELAKRGAEVVFITGPCHEIPSHKAIELVKVETAQQMANACIARFGECNGAIMAAAVADFTPQNVSLTKIKRMGDELTLNLSPTLDISKKLGESKNSQQFLVGFALETNNGIENAKKKLSSKNLDFIVLNSLKDAGAGFEHNTNKITIVNNKGIIKEFNLKTKQEVAIDIVNELCLLLGK